MIELFLLLMIGGAAQEDTVNYELVFSTSWQECNDRNYNAIKFYNSIIQEYLKLNELKGVAKSISCKNVSEVFPTYSLRDDVDLTIIIPDWIQSNFYAVAYGQTGVHYYNQKSNVIISTSLAYSSHNPASVWTLSHELMHFVIYFKGYDQSLQEDYVHHAEEEFRKCSSYSVCGDYWKVVNVDGEPFTVMKPLIIPKYDISSVPENIPVKQSPVVYSGKISTDISATINNRVSLSISDVQEICFRASLQEVGTGKLISNKPLLLLYKINSGGSIHGASKVVYTNDSGVYENCSTYGSTMPTSWEFWFKYQGNDNYDSSKSSKIIMRTV